MSNWPTNGNLTGKLSVGQGERGKSLEYMWRGTELGIRQEGEEEYQFVNLAGGGAGNSGADGREIELQVNSGYIQWRYKGEETWNDLIELSALKGKQGPKGERGEKGEQGLQGLPGKDGTNGVDGANGKDGVTPNISIGTVTTLEAGEKATVTKRGTKEEPVFDFGIPKGENGSDGATPDMSDFENKINKQYETIEKKVNDHIENHPEGGGSGVAKSDKVDYIGKQHNTLKETNDSNIEYLLRKLNTQKYEGSSITATNTYAKQVNNVILKGVTKFKDLDTGEFLDSFEEGKNLELVSGKCNNIKVMGRNFFNGNLDEILKKVEGGWTTTHYGDMSSKYMMIQLEPNETWTFSVYGKYPEALSIIINNKRHHQGHKNYVNFNTDDTGIIKLKIGSEGYSNIGKALITHIQIEKGEVCNDYKPYNSNIFALLGEYRAIGNTYDYVDLKTGTYVKNIDIRAYQPGDESNNEVLTDKKITLYKLNQPVITKIDLQGQKMYSYDGTTHYTCQSELGYPAPILSMEVPTDLAALVNNQKMEIKLLNEENKEQDELINTTLLATDEMYMMLEPLLANMLIDGEAISPLVNMYAAMVKRGLKTIEQVPEKYREQVEAIINESH